MPPPFNAMPRHKNFHNTVQKPSPLLQEEVDCSGVQSDDDTIPDSDTESCFTLATSARRSPVKVPLVPRLSLLGTLPSFFPNSNPSFIDTINPSSPPPSPPPRGPKPPFLSTYVALATIRCSSPLACHISSVSQAASPTYPHLYSWLVA